MKAGHLILVGAGPGDAELITLKGVKAIQKAEVLLYDALVNEELIKYAPQNAIKIFVGKRKGSCAYTQEQINKLIVDFGVEGNVVVRLKGGDPFVFGRGFEEIEAAELNGMTSEVIPGISSSISVPALNKIPVSARGCTESFWIITGTTKNHELSEDVLRAVQYNGTVVILMGIHKLEKIAALYIQNGKSEVPIALIQEGSLESQNMVKSTLGNVVEDAKNANIQNPAIIVIGSVVNLYDELQLKKQMNLGSICA